MKGTACSQQASCRVERGNYGGCVREEEPRIVIWSRNNACAGVEHWASVVMGRSCTMYLVGVVVDDIEAIGQEARILTSKPYEGMADMLVWSAHVVVKLLAS